MRADSWANRFKKAVAEEGMMKQAIVVVRLVMVAMMLSVIACSSSGDNTAESDVPAVPEMPAHWKVSSDFQVPEGQLKGMIENLGVDLAGVRNTIYDVDGKRVQINVVVAPDADGAEKLMAKLASMKSEDALLQKDLIIYEFVGQNDVLELIAEGRQHLASL